MLPKKSFYSVVMLLFILSVWFCVPSYATKTEKILIFPFVFHSGEQKDLSFLEKGINRMLHTRLKHENRTETLFVPATDKLPEDPIEAGLLYEADYVLTGSITMFGNKVSTDAIFYSVQDKKELLSFGEFGQSEGDAIEHINNLAIKINYDVFGIDTMPFMPEQLMAAQNPYGFEKTPRFGSPNALALRSKSFDHEIRSIAVGDIDGNGVNEIVYATPSSIKAIQFQGGKDLLIAEQSISNFNSIIRIDVFDFNNNGRDEIIITASNANEAKNASMAYEMAPDKTFKKLEISSNYFYALQYESPGRPVLVAQGREGKGAFERKAYQVDVTDTGFSISNKLYNSPEESTIYSFSGGDIFNNNTMGYAAYMDSDGIRVLDASFIERGSKIGEYGKSLSSFITSEDMARGKDDNYPEYITQRIIIADLNRDGKNEIVVVENLEGATSFIARLRAIKWGKLIIYSWDDPQQALQKVWESEAHSGGITDINIGDVNDDGKVELVYAVMPAAKNLLNIGNQQQSYIIVKGF